MATSMEVSMFIMFNMHVYMHIHASAQVYGGCSNHLQPHPTQGVTLKIS